MWNSFWLIVATIITIASCAPVLSSEVRRLADGNLTFQQLIQDPEAYRGKIVIVGGRILQSFTEEGQTWLEVLQQPLGWQDKPESSDISYGRFLVRFPEYKDPEIYQKDQLITVAAEITGTRQRMIDTIEYRYPVVTSREAHIWQPGENGSPRFHFGIGIGGVIR